MLEHGLNCAHLGKKRKTGEGRTVFALVLLLCKSNLGVSRWMHILSFFCSHFHSTLWSLPTSKNMSLLLLELKPEFRLCYRSMSSKGSIQCGECMCKVTEWAVLPSASTEVPSDVMPSDVIPSFSRSCPGHPSVLLFLNLPLISCSVRKLLPQCGFQTFLSVF